MLCEIVIQLLFLCPVASHQLRAMHVAFLHLQQLQHPFYSLKLWVFIGIGLGLDSCSKPIQKVWEEAMSQYKVWSYEQWSQNRSWPKVGSNTSSIELHLVQQLCKVSVFARLMHPTYCQACIKSLKPMYCTNGLTR